MHWGRVSEKQKNRRYGQEILEKQIEGMGGRGAAVAGWDCVFLITSLSGLGSTTTPSISPSSTHPNRLNCLPAVSLFLCTLV